jgi:hypothetical protein
MSRFETTQQIGVAYRPAIRQAWTTIPAEPIGTAVIVAL